MRWLNLGKRGDSADASAKTFSLPAGPSDPQRRTTEIGRELLHAAREHRTGPFSARFWSDQLMTWAMKDPAFKVQLFRFIDVFPMLRTPEQVHDYLLDYLGQPGVTLPPGMELGLKAGGLAKGLVAKTMAGRITAMAHRFLAGADVASALPVLQELWSDGVAFSVALLGETCLSHEEAHTYQRRYIDVVETLAAAVRRWPPNPLFETDHLGPIPRVNVSIKLSSLCARPTPLTSRVRSMPWARLCNPSWKRRRNARCW